MSNFITLFIALSIIGCAQVGNQNRLSTSKMVFKGGIYGKKQWDDKIEMMRYSWFSGATLSYDLVIGELKAESSFNNWLSDTEKTPFKDCLKVYIGLLYSYQLNNKSIITLTDQLDKQGLIMISLPRFSSHFRGHYSFNDRRLHQHRIVGFCQQRVLSAGKNVEIDIPGFETLEIPL